MYLATYPSYWATVSVTHLWYAPITSLRSSGSNREARTVESTRSQNITVSWRRSALDDAQLSVTPFGADPVVEEVFSVAGVGCSRRAAIAASSLRRWPIEVTPR